MNWTIAVIAILIAVALAGVICISYQLYQIVIIDAKARGLKHPKIWGFFAMSSNNGGGLIPYLIVRRRYPVVFMSDAERLAISKGKKAIGIALIFLSASVIGLVICM